jgi:hypothetical protein
MRTTGTSLYDKDFYAWTQEQAALVRSGKVHELDIENVAEELESLGKSEWRALGSRLDVLVRHLLKWRYQSVRRSPSWQSSIWTQRRAIQRLLRLSPSLRRQVPTMILEDYASIRKQAATETRLPLATFPEVCPWTSEQVLDEDFWPEESAETDQPLRPKDLQGLGRQALEGERETGR